MKVVGPFINIASLIFLKIISPPNDFTVIKLSFFDKKFDATHKEAYQHDKVSPPPFS